MCPFPFCLEQTSPIRVHYCIRQPGEGGVVFHRGPDCIVTKRYSDQHIFMSFVPWGLVPSIYCTVFKRNKYMLMCVWKIFDLLQYVCYKQIILWNIYWVLTVLFEGCFNQTYQRWMEIFLNLSSSSLNENNTYILTESKHSQDLNDGEVRSYRSHSMIGS